MNSKNTLASVGILGVVVALGTGAAISAQDKYTLKVPGGLAFSEFRGFEDWRTVAVSQSGDKIEVILANQVMIDAYRAGVTGEGKKFPDGSKLAKIHWMAKKSTEPGAPIIPDALHDVDFMVRDSTRFADSGSWGYAVFEYDAPSDTFRPGTQADQPPQANDAKCGFACHTVVANRDFVFTVYGKR
jgi:hypothetical protein